MHWLLIIEFMAYKPNKESKRREARSAINYIWNNYEISINDLIAHNERYIKRKVEK